METRLGTRLLVALVALTFCTGLAFAQRALTIEDAVQMAFQNNISIERSALTLKGLERAKNHAWNEFSPSVSVGGGYSLNNSSNYSNRNGYRHIMYGNASISFNLSPALIAGIKTARLQYETGELTFDDAVRSIELSVRQAFYGLLYEREYIVQQERSLETALQQYEQNQRQYSLGRISELDLLSAQVEYEQLKPSLETARATYLNDLDTFKLLIGVDLSEDIELNGSLDDFLLIGEIVLRNEDINPPSVALLEKQLETARSTLTSTRLYYYGPTIGLSWNMQPTTAGGGLSGSLGSDWYDSGGLALSVSIPIDCYFPWSSSADSIAEAKDNVTDIELQLKDEIQNVRSEISSYLRQIDVSRSSIETCQANVNLAQRSYELAREAYNRGARDLLSLQDASDTLFEAQVALLSEMYNLSVNILNLENTTGIPFGTFIRSAR